MVETTLPDGLETSGWRVYRHTPPPLLDPPHLFFWIFIFFLINHASSSNLYWSRYPHLSRELVSPVCRIFLVDFYAAICKYQNVSACRVQHIPQIVNQNEAIIDTPDHIIKILHYLVKSCSVCVSWTRKSLTWSDTAIPAKFT
jgi:hypothetical protein